MPRITELTSLVLLQRFSLLLAFFLPGCAWAIAQPLTFDTGTVGGPASEARAEPFAPVGAGPFPAVVVLHGLQDAPPRSGQPNTTS